MSTPDPPSESGTIRRRVQRFKRGGHQPHQGSQARSSLSRMLLRKRQTQTPPDTDERSLVIGSFYGAPLGARMHSPRVHPAVGRRGELKMTASTYSTHPDALTFRAHWHLHRYPRITPPNSSTTCISPAYTQPTQRQPTPSYSTYISQKPQHMTQSTS